MGTNRTCWNRSWITCWRGCWSTNRSKLGLPLEQLLLLSFQVLLMMFLGVGVKVVEKVEKVEKKEREEKVVKKERKEKVEKVVKRARKEKEENKLLESVCCENFVISFILGIIRSQCKSKVQI